MVQGSSLAHAIPSQEKIVGLLTYGRTAFFIGYDNGIPAGFIGITITPFFFSDVRRATDLGFYISPCYRGGSLAKRLITIAEDWAKLMGATTIFMGQTVGNKMDSTLKFYERNGYELCGFNTMKRI